jgi:hypothetical protein
MVPRRHPAGLLLALVIAVPSSSVADEQPAELIERTMAIVGGQVITLSDVRTAMALGLVDADSAAAVETAAARLVDRLLILREVQRYLPPEPAEAQVDDALAGVRQRSGSADRFAAALSAGGFNEARLRSWLRDDLRIAAYLGQRFAAVGVPSDEDVRTYYTDHREEFDRARQPFDAAVPVIRDRLASERRAQLIADWVQDLRRRTPIVELWKGRG